MKLAAIIKDAVIDFSIISGYSSVVSLILTETENIEFSKEIKR